MKRSKRYKALLESVPEEPVELPKAVELLKGFEGGKFDQTVEIHMHLGIDPKQADQIVRGSIVPVSYTHLRGPRDRQKSRMPSSA